MTITHYHPYRGRFPRLGLAVEYCEELNHIAAGERKELEAWMETHEAHLDAGDSFDCIDGSMHTVPAS